MNLRSLFTDDGAVSPVIGVILMVAITVILAAVIAAFVLGIGSTQSSPPQITFDYNYDSNAGELTITHVSGDEFFTDRITFQGEGIASNDLGSTWTSSKAGLTSNTQVTAGGSVTIGITDKEFEIELVWTADDDEESSVISENSGPLPSGPTP
jgi:flagellin-like protein